MVRKAVVLAMGVAVAGLGAEGAITTARTQAAVTVPALARVAAPEAQVAGREIQVSVRVPPATAGGVAWVELPRAVILVVRTNVPWTLTVRPPDNAVLPPVEVRTGQGTYQPMRPEGLAIAKGRPGVHEIVLDYRVAGGGTRWEGEPLLTLVYAVGG